MQNIRITKSFNFETAHALYGYDGKCKNIHGHSYKLYVTLKGSPIKDSNNVKYGMVMDFGDLKKIIQDFVIQEFDHAILLNKNTPHKRLGEHLKKEGHKVIFTDYQPSCENMILDIVNRVQDKFPDNVLLISLKLQETETSFAEWKLEDN